MASQANPLYQPQPYYDPTYGGLYGTSAPAQQSIYGTYNPSGVNTGEYGGSGSPSGLPTYNTDPNTDIHNSFYQTQGIINAQGDQINQEALSQLNYYSPIQQQYQQKQDQALDQLQQTPGYNQQEAGQINVDYGQFRQTPEQLSAQYLTPDEQQSVFGNPSAVQQTMQAGVNDETAALGGLNESAGAQLNAYGANLGGQVGNYQGWTGQAAQDLGSGLQKAQGGFGKLDTAVNNPGLAFDPNNTEKQLSDADVQEMKTAAGTRIGNQYQTAQDQLQRQAAAAGNTSPLAIAAANAQLQHQEAADQGDAETNADIAARQAQYARAAGIEGQREGAVQTQAGMQAGAATTEQQQAQNAAALAGTQNIAAAESMGQAGINAANTYGSQALNEAMNVGEQNVATRANEANQLYGAAANEDTASSQRAAQIAGNRQGVYGNILNAQYGQGMQTTQATSQGAQAVGNARMAGEQAYRTGVQQQQGLAQQGGQNAVNQQLQAYGTRTSGLNQSVANRANYDLGAQGNSPLNQARGWAGTMVSALRPHEKGGIVDKPTLATVGERGPEMVIPLPPRYGSGGRKAA